MEKTRPISLFALTIAKSGERKSYCDALAMEPIRAFERELADAHQDDQARHRDEAEIWEAEHSRLIKEAIHKDALKSTAAKADFEALGAEPQPPQLPCLTETEPTLEGLTKNSPMQQPLPPRRLSRPLELLAFWPFTLAKRESAPKPSQNVVLTPETGPNRV